MQRLIIFLFISLFSQSIMGSEVSDLVEKYEAEVETEIKTQKKSEEDKYYIYALFARELLGLKEYKLAKKYYSKALESGENAEILDMSEIHYNMLYIRYMEGADKEELKSLLSIVKRVTPEQSNRQVKMALSHWDKIINGSDKLDKDLLNGFYGFNYSQEMLKKYIKEKEYKKAFLLLPTKLDKANIIYKVQHDILQKLVYPDKTDFLCYPVLKKYPKTITYTMQICRYLKNRDVSLEDIAKQIEKESSDKSYLLSALKDIK
jgi:tetratricopeptide (TPR) repeat protein